jgi:hypothetical protein
MSALLFDGLSEASTMQRVVAGFGTGLVLLLLVAVTLAGEDKEEKVPLNKAPQPVLAAVKARFQGAELKGASKEKEDGQQVYEVTIKHQGQTIDVTLTPAGEILLIEKTIPAQKLPAAVTKTLEGKYPQAKYKIVEEITRVEKEQEKLAFYEVLLTTSEGQSVEVELTPQGRIVHEEKQDRKKEGE